MEILSLRARDLKDPRATLPPPPNAYMKIYILKKAYKIYVNKGRYDT